MLERKVTLPEMMLVAGTRLFLGVGIGLLAAGYCSETQRLAIGWTLVIIGVLITIPLLWEIWGKKRA